MGAVAEDRIAKVTELKDGLTRFATGHGFDDEARYWTIRTELIRAPWAKGLVPECVRKCTDLGDFWSFIKGKFAHYAERREYLRDAFDPLLTKLEQEPVLPLDGPVTQALAKVDSAHVHEAWMKALERRDQDPEGAMTAARSLLETVCKHILDDLGVEYGPGGSLPKLYGGLARALNLAPSQHEERVFKQILGGCQTVVDNLGALRNLSLIHISEPTRPY